MDKIIGRGKISANSVIVYSNLLNRAIGRKKYVLSFQDNDAFPFGRFPIMKLNGEVIYKFYVGNQGEAHIALQQIANIENQRTLGSNWFRNPKYSDFSKQFRIQSAGRIWVHQKIMVMRDSRPTPQIVKYVIFQLQSSGVIDIMSYKMLYEDNQGYIHQCTVEDYLKGSASSFGYQTSEDIPNNSEEENNKKELTREIPQAEYNFYKRYGLGDSKKPRFTNLNETLIGKLRIKEIISETLNRFLSSKT